MSERLTDPKVGAIVVGWFNDVYGRFEWLMYDEYPTGLPEQIKAAQRQYGVFVAKVTRVVTDGFGKPILPNPGCEP